MCMASLPMSEASRTGPLHKLRRLAYLGPVGWGDLLRATLELAVARHKLGSQTVRELLETTRLDRRPAASDSLSDAQLRLIGRVSFVVPRVGARLPWRADCLVQALAAQRWLGSSGIPTDLYIGVQKEAPSGFEAHAWLMRGDTIVTGGNREDFTPLVTPTHILPGAR